MKNPENSTKYGSSMDVGKTEMPLTKTEKIKQMMKTNRSDKFPGDYRNLGPR